MTNYFKHPWSGGFPVLTLGQNVTYIKDIAASSDKSSLYESVKAELPISLLSLLLTEEKSI